MTRYHVTRFATLGPLAFKGQERETLLAKLESYRVILFRFNFQQEGSRQRCFHEQTIPSSINAVFRSRRHALLLWDLVILFTSTLHIRAL